MPTPKKTKTDTIAQNAAIYYVRNQESNAAKREADKARAALLKEMTVAGIEATEVTVNIDGKPQTLRVAVETPIRDVVDVNLLKKLVDPEVFFQVISASKAEVTRLCGEATTLRVCVPEEGKTNVTVKPA